jgi:hypothetical protein
MGKGKGHKKVSLLASKGKFMRVLMEGSSDNVSLTFREDCIC